MKVPPLSSIGKYTSYFSPLELDKKLRAIRRIIGQKAVYSILLLLYILKDGNLSKEDKLLIIGTLGYFIFPIDLIPDLIPVLGYSDDIAAITMLLKRLYDNVTPEIEAKAQKRTEEIFGFFDKTILKNLLKV